MTFNIYRLLLYRGFSLLHKANQQHTKYTNRIYVVAELIILFRMCVCLDLTHNQMIDATHK